MAGYVEPASVIGQAVTPVAVFRPVFGCDNGFSVNRADVAQAA